MKANRKWLKVVLVSGVRNFGPFSIVLELVEFPLFDNLFLDLVKFQDLDVFPPFDFPDLDNFQNLDVFSDFLACSTLFPITLTPSTSPLPLFLPEASLLLSFLLEADLLLLFLLGAGLSGDPVIFSIEVSGATILLKPWMNRQ